MLAGGGALAVMCPIRLAIRWYLRRLEARIAYTRERVCAEDDDAEDPEVKP